MKIIDKIISQTGEPVMSNVMWHNPETGELKMFGSSGWKSVGEGYSIVEVPVQTIPDGTTTATIDIKPFTYYKVKCDNLIVKKTNTISNIAVEYVVDATCGSITWDFPVYWNNDVEPTVDKSTRNIYSIVDNIAVFCTVTAEE